MTNKFCKDCKHLKWDVLPLDLRYCKVSIKNYKDVDLVSGKTNYDLMFAKHARSWGPCGPDGIYFEQKKSWWKFW